MSESAHRRRTFFQNVSMQKNFAATDGTLTLISGVASHTIYVQKIVVTISTSAAQAITFQDSGNVYVAKMPASPGVDTRWEFDFGSIGHALTSGDDLQMAMTAGNAGHVEVEAYMQTDNAATGLATPANDVSRVSHA